MSEMKLSEAMRLGAILRPQCVGRLFSSNGESCAMGAVIEACGIEDKNPHCTVAIWNTTIERFPMLAWGHSRFVFPEMGGAYRGDLWDAIVALNNVHKWTRERIADWVETIECQQEAGRIEVETPVSA